MRSIYQYLGSRITEKKQLIEKLNATILPLLPEVSRSHINSCSYNEQTQELILIVDSPVWAARLRTQHKTIISTLKNELAFSVNSFKIKFQQPVKNKPKVKKTPLFISTETSERLLQTANTLEDESLKESLIQLSKHTDQ